MKRYFLTAALIAAFLLASCRTNPITQMNVDKQTIDDIAFCDGGVSSSLSTELKASIQTDLAKPNGEFGAELNNELSGIYAKKMPPNDAREAVKELRDCMFKRVESRKVSAAAIESCKANWTCDLNTGAGLCTCRQVIEESKKKYKWTDEQSAKKYAEMCSPSIANFSSCWPGQNISTGRAQCEVKLKNVWAIPKLDPGTCKLSS